MLLNQRSTAHSEDVVGLIPAGGSAHRMSPLPCSKEILPVGAESIAGTGRIARVASSSLLQSMHAAGVRTAFWVLRKGKWDIPSYFGNGSQHGLFMAYLVTSVPYGVPFTLQEAVPFIGDARIAFGFPDVIFQPIDAFTHLLSRQKRTGATVTLGLFPVDRPEDADVVECDEQGLVRRIDVKPASTNLEYAWMLAVWQPEFTTYMSAYVESAHGDTDEERTAQNVGTRRELHIGHVFQAAIDDGRQIDAVIFHDGACIDVGTIEGWTKALRSDL